MFWRAGDFLGKGVHSTVKEKSKNKNPMMDHDDTIDYQ